MKKLIAGNWKMNGSADGARSLIAGIVNKMHENPSDYENCDLLVCPPFIHISAVKHSLTGLYTMNYGAQDCSSRENGAFTGDISAEMLSDYGCAYVILGHSERRQYHGESSEDVAAKATLAHEQRLITIICVGEQESERDAGNHEDIVAEQLAASIPEGATSDNTVIAYEPVWAIGTGKTASPSDVEAMHAHIRDVIQDKIQDADSVRILYGGSMKPDNAAELLATANVDGGLIGGASLKADDFLAIARCA